MNRMSATTSEQVYSSQSPLVAICTLKKICNHPALLYEKLNNINKLSTEEVSLNIIVIFYYWFHLFLAFPSDKFFYSLNVWEPDGILYEKLAYRCDSLLKKKY